MQMSAFGFSHPWLLLLALIPPALSILVRLPGMRRRSALFFSGFDWMPASGAVSSFPQRLAGALRLGALLCLTLIAAGFRTGGTATTVSERSEALVVVLDVSSSMTAEDFSPQNRLECAKALLSEYVNTRSGTEVGLILLAASPRLSVPVTAESQFLSRALQGAGPAAFGEDGTALGSGIASAVNRLRDGPWDRRRVLLVTDGVNNRGALAPADAARLAARLGIRIDTIGIGSDAVSRYWAPSAAGPPVEIRARIQIDDRALDEVSRITGGSYRRVGNADELRGALAAMGEERDIERRISFIRPDFSRVQLLAALSVILIGFEFVWRRFLFPELPG